MSQIFDLSTDYTVEALAEATSAVATAVANGELAVIPTDTSYAIICDAFNSAAVLRLRAAKNQPEDASIPVGAGNLATVDGIATFTELARDLVLAFWPGALTLLTRNQPSVELAVKPSDSALAIRIPKNDIAISVLNAIGPTAMTGAQKSGQAPLTNLSQARELHGDSVTIYVDAGPLSGAVSSVVSAIGDSLRLVRLGNVSLIDLRAVVPAVVDATNNGNF